MRLVAGQKYIKGPHGEVMPFTADMAKITGCVVFTQDKDFADSMQLVENENMQRYRGRRVVETKSQSPDITEPGSAIAQKTVVSQPQIKKPIKPVPPQKKVFEAEFDLREEINADMKNDTSNDVAELD